MRDGGLEVAVVELGDDLARAQQQVAVVGQPDGIDIGQGLAGMQGVAASRIAAGDVVAFRFTVVELYMAESAIVDTFINPLILPFVC